MAQLKVSTSEGQKVWELRSHNTVGRHPENDIQLLDRIVSKEHCHVDAEEGRWVLKDLGSLNGTYVNGERVKERVLSDGDEVALGASRMIFVDAAGTVPGVRLPSSEKNAPQAGTLSINLTRSEVAAPVVEAALHTSTNTKAIGRIQKKRQHRVTMTPGTVESHIHKRLQIKSQPNFVPEAELYDEEALRVDYEKLRVSYEVIRALGVELDVDRLSEKMLDCAFEILEADRGVVLLYDDNEELKPVAVKSKREEDVELSGTIVNEVLRDRAGVLSSDASVDSRFQGSQSIIMQGIRSSMAVPLIHSEDLLGLMVIDSQVATNAFTEKDLQLFQSIANQAAIALQNSLYALKLEEEALTRQRFQKLLSPAIAEQVISGEVAVEKGGQLRETTVLFTDIRGFTSMSERASAEEVVDMLNEYFERMVEIIFDNEGTLDKFVGDEIMALFGSPVSHEDDPVRAVNTAIEMLEGLEVFNKERKAERKEEIHVGVGVNTGEVVAGYLGSSKALEYTVIGDTVNTGARLCGLAEPGQIIISESTHSRVKEQFTFEALPPTTVKGKAQPLRIYRVTGRATLNRGRP